MSSSSKRYPDIDKYIESVEHKDGQLIDISQHVEEFFKFHDSIKNLISERIEEEDKQRNQRLKAIDASFSASPRSKVVIPADDEFTIKQQLLREKQSVNLMMRMSEASAIKAPQEKKERALSYDTIDFALEPEIVEELKQTIAKSEPEQKVAPACVVAPVKTQLEVVLPTIAEISQNPLQSSSTMKTIMQSLAQPDSPLGKSVNPAILVIAKQKHTLSTLVEIQKRAIGVFDSYFEMFLDDETLNENHVDRRKNRNQRETISYYLNQMKSIPCDSTTEEEYLHKKACMIKVIRSFFLTFKPFHIEVTQEPKPKKFAVVHFKNTSMRLTEDLLNDLQSVYYNDSYRKEMLKKKKIAEQSHQAEEKLYKRKESVLNALSECVKQHPDHSLANSCGDYFQMIGKVGGRDTDITKADRELDKLIPEANALIKKINEAKPSHGRFWGTVSAIASYVSGSQSQAKPAGRPTKH